MISFRCRDMAFSSLLERIPMAKRHAQLRFLSPPAVCAVTIFSTGLNCLLDLPRDSHCVSGA